MYAIVAFKISITVWFVSPVVGAAEHDIPPINIKNPKHIAKIAESCFMLRDLRLLLVFHILLTPWIKDVNGNNLTDFLDFVKKYCVRNTV
jgi:hypothetical protein